ncbi:MAG: hypothetical protein JNJ60_16255 [Rhodocyclaceae bacterium]|nr:hypothetical protein [Rhodocyclaceae bacterium]
MHPPRRTLIKTLAASPLLLSALLRREAHAGSLGQGIRGFRGSVTVNGAPAYFRMPVGSGDTLRTGPASEALVVFGSDAFLLRADSHMAFGSSGAASFLRVLSGALLSVFGHGPKRLQTPTASIGIRGTGCYIEAGAAQTYFCLCYGAADIQPHAQPEQAMQIVTRHHDSPLLIHGAGVEKLMESSSVRNHTDAELELIESLVGRRPPFRPGTDYPY